MASLSDRKKYSAHRQALLRLYFTARKRPGFLMDSYTSTAVVDAFTLETRQKPEDAGTDGKAADVPPTPAPHTDAASFTQILADIADAGLRAPPQALRECCYRLLYAGLNDQALAVFELLVQQYSGLPPYSDLMSFVLSRNPDISLDVRLQFLFVCCR